MNLSCTLVLDFVQQFLAQKKKGSTLDTVFSLAFQLAEVLCTLHLARCCAEHCNSALKHQASPSKLDKCSIGSSLNIGDFSF